MLSIDNKNRRKSDGKESACSAGDLGSIPGSGRSPGEWQPSPVFLLGEFHRQRNLMWATVRGVAKSQTQLSN